MNEDQKLTDSKLKIAYWIVSNRLFIKRMVFFILFAFDVLIVSFSVYSLIQYYSVERVHFEKTMSSLEHYNLDYTNYQKKIKPKDIQILELDAVNLRGSKYNFVARVKNPNINTWIAREIHYYFVYNNQKTKMKTAFVLPGEDKFLGVFNVQSSLNVLKPKLKIHSVRWQRIKNGDVETFAQDIKKYTNFQIKNTQYMSATDLKLSADDKINAIAFTVINNTVFDYYNVGFFIVTYNGPIITSVNHLILNNFKAGDIRREEVRWSNIIAKPTLIVIKPEINFLDKTIIVSKDYVVGDPK